MKNSNSTPTSVLVSTPVPPPVSIALDRTVLVKNNQIIVTGWVSIDLCVLGCRDRMAAGDVERKWNEILQRGGDAVWPPASGYWRVDGRFVIQDGRHEFIATLMHGHEKIFVAWLESNED